MIRSIDSLISLPANDPSRARRFYAEVLGLTTIFESPQRDFAIYAGRETPGTLVGIHRSDRVAPPVESQDTWFWLKVDDISEARRTLESRGVTFIGETNDLGPGHDIRFLDSEGNVLRLFAPLREVRRSIEIAAPPAAVWATLTQARQIERWFAAVDDVTLETTLGGRISFIDPALGRVEGKVTALEPERRIAFEFTQNWPTHLEIALATSGAKTRVDVWQHGFEPIRDRDFGIPAVRRRIDDGLAGLDAAFGRAGAPAGA
jgi:uncharacterized protein YndB with AHSA1/START domain/predicted enzyme related to lactoylglutathione lyase